MYAYLVLQFFSFVHIFWSDICSEFAHCPLLRIHVLDCVMELQCNYMVTEFLPKPVYPERQAGHGGRTFLLNIHVHCSPYFPFLMVLRKFEGNFFSAHSRSSACVTCMLIVPDQWGWFLADASGALVAHMLMRKTCKVEWVKRSGSVFLENSPVPFRLLLLSWLLWGFAMKWCRCWLLWLGTFGLC